MPTARELLEQADALMRRNRAADADIPVLTDVVDDADEHAFAGAAARERSATGRDASRENAPTVEKVEQAGEAPGPPERRAADAVAGPPTLTDPVEELAIDIPPLPEPSE